MLTANPSFIAVVNGHKVKDKVKPSPYELTNFEEFRKVYSERRLSVQNSQFRPPSARPKNDVKTIKLHIPLMGSENAIVGFPALPKKCPIKSILKKSLLTPIKSTKHIDLVKKITKMGMEECKIKTPLKPSSAPLEDVSDKRIKTTDIVEIQKKQINSMFPKIEKKSQIRESIPANRTTINLDYLNLTKYPLEMKSLMQDEEKDEQISDIEVLYENKTYLEDLKDLISDLDKDTLLGANNEHVILPPTKMMPSKS